MHLIGRAVIQFVGDLGLANDFLDVEEDRLAFMMAVPVFQRVSFWRSPAKAKVGRKTLWNAEFSTPVAYLPSRFFYNLVCRVVRSFPGNVLIEPITRSELLFEIGYHRCGAFSSGGFRDLLAQSRDLQQPLAFGVGKLWAHGRRLPLACYGAANLDAFGHAGRSGLCRLGDAVSDIIVGKGQNLSLRSNQRRI